MSGGWANRRSAQLLPAVNSRSPHCYASDAISDAIRTGISRYGRVQERKRGSRKASNYHELSPITTGRDVAPLGSHPWVLRRNLDFHSSRTTGQSAMHRPSNPDPPICSCWWMRHLREGQKGNAISNAIATYWGVPGGARRTIGVENPPMKPMIRHGANADGRYLPCLWNRRSGVRVPSATPEISANTPG